MQLESESAMQTYYNVVHKKDATLFWTITTTFRGGFLQCFYQWKQMNALWMSGSYKIYNAPPDVSPHHLLKRKRHKQRLL